MFTWTMSTIAKIWTTFMFYVYRTSTDETKTNVRFDTTLWSITTWTACTAHDWKWKFLRFISNTITTFVFFSSCQRVYFCSFFNIYFETKNINLFICRVIMRIINLPSLSVVCREISRSASHSCETRLRKYRSSFCQRCIYNGVRWRVTFW